MDTSPLTFGAWISGLTARGFTVLPSSHAVPVQLWLRDDSGRVLHFLARGTRLSLREYLASDLTGMILRSECDCAEHRTAGAGRRTVLVPGATPVAEATFDGERVLGWSSIEAGLLDVPSAALWFDRLFGELMSGGAARGAADRLTSVRPFAVA